MKFGHVVGTKREHQATKRTIDRYQAQQDFLATWLAGKTVDELLSMDVQKAKEELTQAPKQAA